MLNFLEKNKTKKAIYYHEGCVEFYNTKIKELELRIEKGKSAGADKPENQYHDLFKSLSSEMEGLINRRDEEIQKVKDLEIQL